MTEPHALPEDQTDETAATADAPAEATVAVEPSPSFTPAASPPR